MPQIQGPSVLVHLKLAGTGKDRRVCLLERRRSGSGVERGEVGGRDWEERKEGGKIVIRLREI